MIKTSKTIFNDLVISMIITMVIHFFEKVCHSCQDHKYDDLL